MKLCLLINIAQFSRITVFQFPPKPRNHPDYGVWRINQKLQSDKVQKKIRNRLLYLNKKD